MVDESTDISVTKELILYARILQGNEVHVHFPKIIHIPDGTTETIVKAVLAYLHQVKITRID